MFYEGYEYEYDRELGGINILSYRGEEKIVNVPSEFPDLKGIPVVQIGYRAFTENGNIEEVNIPEGVKIIDDKAFRSCENLKKVNLPKSLKSIGKTAFYGCISLPSVNIPDNVEKIGDYAFERCYLLEQAAMPPRFKNNKKRIFGGASGLGTGVEVKFTKRDNAKRDNTERDNIESKKYMSNESNESNEFLNEYIEFKNSKNSKTSKKFDLDVLTDPDKMPDEILSEFYDAAKSADTIMIKRRFEVYPECYKIVDKEINDSKLSFAVEDETYEGYEMLFDISFDVKKSYFSSNWLSYPCVTVRGIGYGQPETASENTKESIKVFSSPMGQFYPEKVNDFTLTDVMLSSERERLNYDGKIFRWGSSYACIQRENNCIKIAMLYPTDPTKSGEEGYVVSRNTIFPLIRTETANNVTNAKPSAIQYGLTSGNSNENKDVATQVTTLVARKKR